MTHILPSSTLFSISCVKGIAKFKDIAYYFFVSPLWHRFAKDPEEAGSLSVCNEETSSASTTE